MKSTEFTLFSQKFKPRYLPVKNENQKNIFNSIFYAAQAFYAAPSPNTDTLVCDHPLMKLSNN